MVQTRFYIFFVMLILMPACKIDRKNRVERDRFTFTYSHDSFLFFKNVRQIYYDFQDLPQARWHAFRYSDRYITEERPTLTPVIVIDWFKNESYVLIEGNKMLQEENAFVIREKNPNGRFYEYSLKDRGRENMLEFATKIYEGIRDNHEIFILIDGAPYALFKDEDDKDNFRVVLADYYRLTRIF